MPCEGDVSDNGAERSHASVGQWNSKIVLVARVGKGIIGIDVPVMIEEMSVFCKARLQLELSPSLPFVSKVQFSLLELPKIDFILKPLKALDLMDLPGLSSWLTNTINEILQNKLVDPNMIEIPLSRKYSDVQAIGVLKVTLYQMRGVKMVGNMAEPFVRLQLAGRVKGISKSISAKDTEWNQIFFVLLYHLNNPLVLVVHGSNRGVMGSTTFPLSDIDKDAGSSTNIWRTIVGHESSKIRGELNFGVEYFPAAETPSPEADLNFESGIVQITIHQVKDIVVPDKKILNCCYELYIHPTTSPVNINALPTDCLDNCYYRSRAKKKSPNPSWNDVYEVFLEYKDHMSVTLVLRHATKDDIFAHWSAPFKQLLNITDWFYFEGSQKAQFFASFIFRPVRADLTNPLAERSFLPATGIVRLHLVSASGLKSVKSGYQAVVYVDGTVVGKTRISLSDSSPVWNKTIFFLLRDGRETISIEVASCEKQTKGGTLSLTTSELFSHKGIDIDKHEDLRAVQSDKPVGKLRFSVGFFPKHGEGGPPEDATSIVPVEYDASTHNCGILELQSIAVEGVDPSGIECLNYVTIMVGDGNAMFKTPSVRIGIEGKQEWVLNKELIVADPETRDVGFSFMETRGAHDEVMGIAGVSLGEAKCGQLMPLETLEGTTTDARISLCARFHPVPLFVEAEAEEAGRLKVTIHDAQDLIAVDLGGTSDPFCVLRINGLKFYKSKVIKKCLAPVYDETAEVEIKQKDASVLQIELRDWNLVAASRTLGHVSVELQNIPPGEAQKMNLPLENVSSGSVSFTVEFTPTAAPPKPKSRRRENPAIAISRTYADSTLLPMIPESLPVALSEEEARDEAAAAETEATLPKASTSAAGPRASTLTLSTASGLKITIAELELPPGPRGPGECKVKVRRDTRTLFKTREIKHAPYRWNESFTIDSESVSGESVLTLLISLEGQELECTIKPRELASDLESGEMEKQRKISCGGSGGLRLVLRYAFTMDTANMLDHSKKRRFSFFNH